MTSKIDREAYQDAYMHIGGLEKRGARTWPPIPSPGSNWELFVDKGILNDALPRMHNVRQTLHHPVKYEGNPIFVPENSWEGTECPPVSYPHDFCFYGATLYDEDEQLFKMWYNGVGGGIICNWLMCYATSKDGIHWQRPNLGMFEYNGSKENNICFGSLDEDARRRGVAKGVALIISHFNGVLKDMDDPDPARRYKTVSLQGPLMDPDTGKTSPTPLTGIYTCVSPDGINWTISEEPAFIEQEFEFGIGDVVTLWYNRKRKKYVVFMKGFIYRPDGTGDMGGVMRMQQVVESDDFENWTTPTPGLYSDDQDPDDMHVYGMTAFDYENMYLGLVLSYRGDDDRRTIDVQLASSRNGRQWWRAGNREAFIPLGEPGSWDSGEVWGHRPPVEVGDELWFYYTGVRGPRPHSPLLPGEPPWSNGELGLAKLKKGRFVSMDAGEEEGWLLTKPMKLKGGTLHLNANAARGDILVEIRESVYHKIERGEYQWDKQLGAPITGFSRHDCNVITTDSLDHVVTWRGNSDLSGIGDKEVMLKFTMRNAELYGFKVCR